MVEGLLRNRRARSKQMEMINHTRFWQFMQPVCKCTVSYPERLLYEALTVLK